MRDQRKGLMNPGHETKIVIVLLLDMVNRPADAMMTLKLNGLMVCSGQRNDSGTGRSSGGQTVARFWDGAQEPERKNPLKQGVSGHPSPTLDTLSTQKAPHFCEAFRLSKAVNQRLTADH